MEITISRSNDNYEERRVSLDSPSFSISVLSVKNLNEGEREKMKNHLRKLSIMLRTKFIRSLMYTDHRKPT